MKINMFWTSRPAATHAVLEKATARGELKAASRSAVYAVKQARSAKGAESKTANKSRTPEDGAAVILAQTPMCRADQRRL